jgi:aryl-alcohol dehydrogenase-like predicted oxidoreductase
MNDLPVTRLGRTDCTVTRIGYGAMELRESRPSFDRRAAQQLLRTVLDSGINFIDTSPDYGDSEAIIGETLQTLRDRFFLASKCGCPINSASMDRRLHNFSRANIRAGVEQSLRRLRTDYLDLVQIHLSPSREELEQNDSVAELDALRREGKIRFIGMSGTLPDLLDHIAMGCFDVFQLPYAVIEPSHDEAMQRAAQADAGIIVRGSVWRAIPHVQIDTIERLRRIVGQILGRRQHLWQAANIDELRGGMPVMEFMLRFTLSHPAQSTTIVGTINPQHLADNVRAARNGPLPADVYAETNRRLQTALQR